MDRSMMARARATYENTENQRVPVRFRVQLYPGAASVLPGLGSGTDMCWRCRGPCRSRPRNIAPDPGQPQPAALQNRRNAPIIMEHIQTELSPGLTLAASAINGLRRDALAMLTAVRGQVPQRREAALLHRRYTGAGVQRPVFTVQIQSLHR